MGSPTASDAAHFEPAPTAPSADAVSEAPKPNYEFFLDPSVNGEVDLSGASNVMVVDITKFMQDPRKTLRALQAAINPPKPNTGSPKAAEATVPETPKADVVVPAAIVEAAQAPQVSA